MTNRIIRSNSFPTQSMATPLSLWKWIFRSIRHSLKTKPHYHRTNCIRNYVSQQIRMNLLRTKQLLNKSGDADSSNHLKINEKQMALRKIAIASVLVSAVSLNGCSSMMNPNAYTGQSQVNDATKGVGIGAVSGAGVGALIGGREGALIGAGAGALVGGLIGHNMDSENTELRQRLVGTGVQVTQNGNETTLLMSSDITFKTDKSNIKQDFYPTLDSVATVLKKYSDNLVIVTGYTDNTGTKTHNQTLSEARAQNVGNYLVSKGVSMNRVSTIGMGEGNPIASNSTTNGRAQNRRVEITLRPRS